MDSCRGRISRFIDLLNESKNTWEKRLEFSIESLMLLILIRISSFKLLDSSLKNSEFVLEIVLVKESDFDCKYCFNAKWFK